MAEAKGVLPSDAVNTLGNATNKWEKIYAKNIDVDGGLIKTINGIAPDEAGNINLGGVPVGFSLPFSGNGPLPEGWLLENGASVLRSMYPDLFAAIGTTYGAEDEEHFNLPNSMNRFKEGSSVAGEYKEAGLPNIEGVSNYAQPIQTEFINIGAFHSGNAVGPNLHWGAGTESLSLGFDASRSNPIYGNSDTVQPASVTVRWAIKAFDSATPDSALVDITQYANELNRLDVHKMDLERDFTIIYPNGGTAESPANVTTRSRYVMDNPFSGYHINCIAQIYVNKKWIDTRSFVLDSSTVGVVCGVVDDNIVVQTARDYLIAKPAMQWGVLVEGDDATTAPCRVKVWKVGKI